MSLVFAPAKVSFTFDLQGLFYAAVQAHFLQVCMLVSALRLGLLLKSSTKRVHLPSLLRARKDSLKQDLILRSKALPGKAEGVQRVVHGTSSATSSHSTQIISDLVSFPKPSCQAHVDMQVLCMDFFCSFSEPGTGDREQDHVEYFTAASDGDGFQQRPLWRVQLKVTTCLPDLLIREVQEALHGCR